MSQSPRLRLYLDTASVAAWQRWLPTGVFYGVTTNPLLLERSQLPCQVDVLARLVDTALELGVEEIQLQTWGESLDFLVDRGQQLAALSPKVVVKVPVTRLGVEAVKRLSAMAVPVTFTAVYAVPQVLLAVALGAQYAAPYLGRINDLGRDGRGELAQMQEILTRLRSPTRLLAASLRTPEDLAVLAAQGLDTFTFSPAVAEQLFMVEATQAAAADFERAAQMAGR